MATSRRIKHYYEFGRYRVDVVERLLLRDGQVVPLPPKIFETLLVLVENGGHLLEKDELIRRLWPDSFVEESSLSQNVFQLRKVLGEGNAEERYIETVPKRGYRFVAAVREVRHVGAEVLAGPRPEPRPESRFVLVRGDGEDEAGLPGTSEFDEVAAAPEAPAPEEREEAPAQVETLRRSRSRARAAAALAGTLVLGAALAYGLYRFARGEASGGGDPFQRMRLTRLSAAGQASYPALSPDGRYLAYVAESAAGQSLWVRQVVTAGGVQIVPPAEVDYQGVAFSRDGNFVYYTARERGSLEGALHQIPVLGGAARKIIDDVDSPVTVSPDGRQLAFIRQDPGRKEAALVVAGAQGGEERKVATRPMRERFSLGGPAWSPDGQMIASGAVVSTPAGSRMVIVGARVSDGSQVLITPRQWTFVGQVAWEADGGGLVGVAWHQDDPVFADQIWRFPYPSGEARRVSNDLNGYTGVSLAADGRAMVTMNATRVSRIWVVSDGEVSHATQITSGFTNNYSEWFGMDWTPDGRIIYSSHASGNLDIWSMNADGGEQRPLTAEGATDRLPIASPDGRHIVFVSNRAGPYNLWRMDADGRRPARLTDGPGENYPSFSPDGRWVYYTAFGADRPAIWKVSIEGGAPSRVTEATSLMGEVSPDGQWLACYWQDDPAVAAKLALLPAAGGKPARFFEAPERGRPLVRWTADGRALNYIVTRDGVSNIWRQPIDGGRPEAVTDFNADQIFRFAYSRDGRLLACERGTTTYDLILFSDFK